MSERENAPPTRNASAIVFSSMSEQSQAALARALIAGSILGIAFMASLSAFSFLAFFPHTSYRLVALFLVVILASNILAKLARAYLGR